MTRQNIARWIFIFGGLAGLFLSGGEGIRLLPFPNAEADDFINAVFILEKNLQSYALSVHNAGNYSPQLKSKSQKNTNQFLTGGHLTFDWSKSLATFCLQSASGREETNASNASGFIILQSDRAPPTV